MQKTALPSVYTPSVYMPPGYIPQGNATTNQPRHINVNKSLLGNLGIPQTRFSNISTESMRHFVFATGSSKTHFEESKDSVASIQKQSPGKDILYFDLGLEEDQRQEVSVKSAE